MQSTTKKLCRAGIIAALYAALTYIFAPLAFGPIQFRPAEALCLLPLLFSEAIPALAVGCALSNLTSPYAIYDIFFGSLATLLAAFITYMVGRIFKNDRLRIVFGGLAPALCNGLILPLIILFVGQSDGGFWITYGATAGSIFLTECIWLYALGTPIYFLLKR